MNTACLDLLLRLKNLIFTRGLTRSLKLARSHAEAAINQETSLAPNKGRWNRSTIVCAIHQRSQLNGRNVASSTVLLNGLRVSGVNVRPHVDKTERGTGKFIVNWSAPTGK